MQSGVITDSAVSKFRMPLDSVSLAMNMHFDQVGAATLRKGTTRLGNQISASSNLLGLYQFNDSGSGTNNQLIAVHGTVAYYLSDSTWTSKRTGLTTGLKARFTTFLDFVWMVNGTDATAIWSGATGDSFVTTGNASGAPIGSDIENFRSRVWITGNPTYPDRLYYSSLPSAVTTPVVTWDTTVTGGQWLDISPSDGENNTGIKRFKRSLLVFKPNHMYRVYSISETDPDPMINVGTYNKESIVEAKDGVYFHHSSGFYKYNEGIPQEISKPIIDVVKAIALSNYDTVAGWLEEDDDHVCWSVGSVTLYGDFTISNCVVRYTISTQVWTIYSYPVQHLIGARYKNSSSDKVEVVLGTNDGTVVRYNVGNQDDASQPIVYDITHRKYLVDGLSTTTKDIEKMLFCTDGKMGGAIIQYQRDDDLRNDWSKNVGQIYDMNSYFSNIDVKGTELGFRLSGVSEGEPFTYYGFEILEGTTELNHATL